MISGITQPIEMDSGITQPIEIKPRITHEIEKKPRITQTIEMKPEITHPIEMKPWMAPHIAMGRREQCRDEPDGGQQEPRRHHQRMQPQMCVTAARQEKAPTTPRGANHEEYEMTSAIPKPQPTRRQTQIRCPIAPNRYEPWLRRNLKTGAYYEPACWEKGWEK